MNFLKVRLLILSMAMLLAIPSFGGGEIPWPLALQQALIDDEATGLWLVTGDSGPFFVNVEVTESDDQKIWVQISQLEYNTKNVVRQGSGYFQRNGDGISIEDGQYRVSPDLGTYVYIKGEGDSQSGIYLRLVLLPYDFGNVLGVTSYSDPGSESQQHQLGYRVGGAKFCPKISKQAPNSSVRCQASIVSGGFNPFGPESVPFK